LPSRKAGERVTAWLRRLYGKLRLTVNDELEAALKAARRAIEYCLKEAAAGPTRDAV
jgi:hypothetical protein